jgi:hypothetical protein
MGDFRRATYPPLKGGLGAGDPAIAAFVSRAKVDYVVPGVAKSYKSVVGRYEAFCLNAGVQPWGVTSELLCGFLVRIMTTVKPSSVKVYVAGVRFAHINHGHVWTLTGDEGVRRVMRFLKRQFPSGGKAKKVAITLAILTKILPLLPGWPNLAEMSHEHRMYAVASVLAVMGFLRGGEFLFDTKRKATARPVLRFSNISIKALKGSRAVVMDIPQPKEAWWLTTVSVPCFELPDPNDPFSPTSLWEGYIARSPHVKRGVAASPTLPAFHMANGSPLTRTWMIALTNQVQSLSFDFVYVVM